MKLKFFILKFLKLSIKTFVRNSSFGSDLSKYINPITLFYQVLDQRSSSTFLNSISTWMLTMNLLPPDRIKIKEGKDALHLNCLR